MSVPTAIIVGAFLGILASLVTYLLLARQLQLTSKLQRGEALLNTFEDTRGRGTELMMQTNTLLEQQKDAILEAAQREERLESLLDRAEKALEKGRNIWGGLEKRTLELEEQKQGLEQSHRKLEELERELAERKNTLAGWTEDDARKAWLEDIAQDCQKLGDKALEAERQHLEERRLTQARGLLLTAIQRQALDQGLEKCLDYVELPNDSYKTRLIGREGRNARTFQRLTGVDLLIDDTPGIVVLSSFDPLRRHLARLTLERLFRGGMIHPGHISDVVKEVRQSLDASVLEKGREVALARNITDLHEDLLILLGRLEYYDSYGQNLLRHSIEVASLAASLAAELGLDAKLAKRCGLLHDIGRVLERDVDLDHEKAGARFAERCGESEAVQQVIAGHHAIEFDDPYQSVVQIADRISSRRPGARTEAVTEHFERLTDMEALAKKFPGVEQAYAFNAGRELHLYVHADEVSARAAVKLNREIARELESELTLPGPVRITLTRESIHEEKTG